MEGQDLEPVIERDETIHESILFGFHAGHINWTDGKTLYMRAPADEDSPAYNFTLMPTHMRNPFPVQELTQAELVAPLSFTKAVPLLKVPAPTGAPGGEPTEPRVTLLFDIENDHEQMNPLSDVEREAEAIEKMSALMVKNEAPAEVFQRYGLKRPTRAN
jgi:hypothetical protein